MARNVEDTPPEAQRKEIFLALVEAQDQDQVRGGADRVVHSRKVIADRFGVSETQVKQIEEEGLDREWPPL
jgi:hypothetical protein